MEKSIPIFNLEITNDLEDDVEVDVVSLVSRPAIERAFLAFKDHEDLNIMFTKVETYDSKIDDYEVGQPHYTKEGVLWEGPTHKDADGRLMTGATHTEDSVYLYHIDEFAKVGPRGGIRESDKAPRSGTKNPNPKGEGTAKGDASGKGGAKVTAAQEETLKKKVKEFNEKESNTKNGNATLGALKSVMQRGLGAYNTSRSPVVKSAEQWAYARVNAFLYLLKNGRPENPKYNTDYDLLPKDHPKTDKFVECLKCGHEWDLEDGGESPYKCHLCNYVNKESFESYTDYPDAVKNNARAALEWAEENGWGSCGTNIGRGRARDLADGKPISLETIKRMYSYLSRHEVDLENSKGYGDGCGKLMYDAWGGKSAMTWAESKIKQVERKTFAIQDEEQKIISGPLMLADTPIYRNDQNGEYYVVFSKETIKKVVQRYFKKGYQANVNLMHESGNPVSGVTMFESFIADKSRGIYPMKGFEDVPDGSWFGSFKVDNDEVWQQIKAGNVRGFSVEGQFNYRKTGESKLEKLWANVLDILSQVKD